MFGLHVAADIETALRIGHKIVVGVGSSTGEPMWVGRNPIVGKLIYKLLGCKLKRNDVREQERCGNRNAHAKSGFDELQ